MIHELLKNLAHNRLCRGVTVIADGIAAQKIADTLTDFTLSNEATSESVLADIGEIKADVCLTFLEEPENSPLLPLLYSAKSILGAKKLYVYLNSPLLQSNFRDRLSGEHRQTMDEIDGIIVNSGAGALVAKEEFDFPEEKIFQTHNLVIEGISKQPMEELRARGREGLGLKDNQVTLLYLGFPSKPTENIGMDPELNVKTFKAVAAGAVHTAIQNPEKYYAVIVRAHPRDPDAHNMFDEIPLQIPDNLTFVTDNKLGFEEAVYASDGVISTPLSTEMELAPFRGRHSLICAFKGPGLTGDLLHNAYPPVLIDTINSAPSTNLIDSSETLASIFSDLKIFEPTNSVENSTTQNISDILLD
jgi:hypothetical protein